MKNIVLIFAGCLGMAVCGCQKEPSLLEKVAGNYRGRLYTGSRGVTLTVRDTVLTVSTLDATKKTISLQQATFTYVASPQDYENHWPRSPSREVLFFDGGYPLYGRSVAIFEQQGDSVYRYYTSSNRNGDSFEMTFYGKKQ